MPLRAHRLFIALMAWRFVVMPLVLGGFFARVHDNLDSLFVYYVLTARFWAGGMDASVLELPLNGVLDWTYFAALTWPLQLPYLLLPPAAAYLLTEVAVVTIAYASMWLLLRAIARTEAARPEMVERVATLMACLFAMTLSFTTLGLGIAAAPLVVLLAWRRLTGATALVLFLVGWNSGLVLHAIFVPVVVLVLSLALRRRLRGTIAPLAIYLTGSTFGALPLFANAVRGRISHRSLWPQTDALPDAGQAAGDLAAALLGQFPWYHATITPALHTLVFLLAGLTVRRRAGGLVAGVLVLAVAIDVLTPWLQRFLPGLVASLQFDRIGQFGAFLVIVLGALVLLAQPSGRAAVWVRGATVLTLAQAMLVWSGVNAATLRAAFPPHERAALRIEARQNGLRAALAQVDLSFPRLAAAVPTVQGHMRSADYACVAQAVGEGRVASAGPDPMLAPLHAIAATDGYQYLYPAAWHAAFRPVIAAKMEASPELRAYYDGWGNRVSLFIDRVPEVPPDFAALRALGTSFVIADRPMPLPLADLPCTLSPSMRLYRLEP